MDREKVKIDQELNESRARANRMEERVKNLNKIVEQLQEQLKERIAEVEAQA